MRKTLQNVESTQANKIRVVLRTDVAVYRLAQCSHDSVIFSAAIFHSSSFFLLLETSDEMFRFTSESLPH